MTDLVPSSPSHFLVVRLKPSKRLAVMLSLAHFAAIGLLWPLMLPVSARLAGSAILIVSLVFYLRRYALLRSTDSVTNIELSEEMTCTLETRRGVHCLRAAWQQLCCALSDAARTEAAKTPELHRTTQLFSPPETMAKIFRTQHSDSAGRNRCRTVQAVASAVAVEVEGSEGEKPGRAGLKRAVPTGSTVP